MLYRISVWSGPKSIRSAEYLIDGTPRQQAYRLGKAVLDMMLPLNDRASGIAINWRHPKLAAKLQRKERRAKEQKRRGKYPRKEAST